VIPGLEDKKFPTVVPGLEQKKIARHLLKLVPAAPDMSTPTIFFFENPAKTAHRLLRHRAIAC